MKHILSVFGSAFLGATVGYVAHQVTQLRAATGDGPRDIIVGAPPITATVAGLIGVVFGRSRAAAFFAGAAIAGSVGDRLDMAVPAIADAKEKLLAMGRRERPGNPARGS